MLRKKEFSERQIVEGCVRNDRRFQEILYRRYFAGMMGMCLRYTNDREQAMEIVNNGFLRVFKKIHTFAFKGSLEGWIRKLVYHSLSDYFKKHSKYIQFMVFEERDEMIESQALSNMYVEDIMSMVEDLPATTKQVFQMYAIEGYTHPEIAKTLGMSVGTSKWHLSHARSCLKQFINQNQNKRHAG